MVEWANDYIGIPYKIGGRDRSGCDCWGLACLILEERYGADIDKYIYSDLDAGYELIKKEKAHFEKIDSEPIPGDLVLFKIMGKFYHVGVVVGKPDERNMLHTLINHDSALDRYNGPKWASRIEGVYRVL